jgi:hypothetical protein
MDAEGAKSHNGTEEYQQFVFQVTDDRHRPVTDYDLTINVWSRSALLAHNIQPQAGSPLPIDMLTAEQRAAARFSDLSARMDKAIRNKAYAHSVQKEFRRFLVNIDEFLRPLEDDHVLTFSIVAESGDERIKYATRRSNDLVVYPTTSAKDPQLFFPNTTTQVMVRLDRYSEEEKIVKVSPGLAR